MYAGNAVCGACHADQAAAWRTSHHHAAMADPRPDTVAGDFADAAYDGPDGTTRFRLRNDRYVVEAIGPAGSPETYEVAHTFGIEPLQQYLLPTGDGRLQALGVAWDNRPATAGGQRWMHLHPGTAIAPDDVLHWTAPANNWNHMCADCHATGVRKGYDASTRRFATTYAEATVGCEACHGPGSAHAAAPARVRTTPLDSPATELNACAPCHSRRSAIAEGFTPAANFLDHYLPALLEAGLYHADGQIQDEVFEYGSFLQSRMHVAGVTCSDCHDPHSARLVLDGNAVCTQCHAPAGQARFPTLLRKDYDSPEHHFHRPGTEAAACVSCHMPAQTYMQVDDRRDHAFRVPRPDLAAVTGAPDACRSCHSDKTPDWAAAAIAGRFDTARPAHFGTVFAAARRGRYDAEFDLAAVASEPSQPPIVRGTALSLMAGYTRGASATALREGLRDPSALVRLGALTGSTRWPHDERWRLTRHLLTAPERAVRMEAGRLLAPLMTTLPASTTAELAAALAEYRQSLELNADRAEAQAARATLHMDLGEAGMAETALNEALRINPYYLPALLNLADLYRASGRDAAAEPLLARAIEAVPDAVEARTARGLWLVRQGRLDAALADLEAAWRTAPWLASSAYVYAIALHSAGASEAALQVLAAALEDNPGEPRLVQTAASIAREAGRTP